jgi:hypothetical protein
MAVAALVGCGDSGNSKQGGPMQTEPQRLRELRDADTLRALLPKPLQSRAIEIDDQESDPDHFFAANLVGKQDRSDLGTIVVSIPPQPIAPEEMDNTKDIYSPFNSPFEFSRPPEDRLAEFGDTAYTRKDVGDPNFPGWALHSNNLGVSLVYPNSKVTDAELWKMASDIRRYLEGA